MTEDDRIRSLKARLRAGWMAGDYETFHRYMEAPTREFFERLPVRPGCAFLDVGCGAGQLALMAARRGAVVTGCDIADNWLERARARAAEEGLPATFEYGDAEALPYRDGEFEIVASLIAAMFAPRPELAASELTRVCRPGGTIAMANWTGPGFMGRMFRIIAPYAGKNPMPSPALWGDETVVRERFRQGTDRIECNKRLYRFDYPFPPAEVVDFFRVHFGPLSCTFDSLDPERQQSLRRELIAHWSNWNQASGQGTRVDSEYLEIVARRG